MPNEVDLYSFFFLSHTNFDFHRKIAPAHRPGSSDVFVVIADVSRKKSPFCSAYSSSSCSHSDKNIDDDGFD